MNPLDGLLAAMVRGDFSWPRGTEPEAFLHRADHHGVSALLHEAIGHGQGVPASVSESLRDRAMGAAAGELVRRREVERVLQSLWTAGVAPIVLKGTALAYLHYGAPHLRPRIDIDLLVPLDSRAGACRALEKAGYTGSASAAGRFVRTQAEFQFLGGEHGLIVDLHWRISTSPMFNHALNYASLRARSVPTLVPRMLAPCAVDALLHACAHRAARIPSYGAGLDRGDRLIWLMDIRVLAQGLDAAHWVEFVDLARERRLCGICVSAFDAAQAAVGAAIPDDVLAALRRHAQQDEPSAALLTGDRWKVLAAELASLEGLGQRLEYLRERTLPPAAYVREKYDGMARWPLPVLYLRHMAEGLRRR